MNNKKYKKIKFKNLEEMKKIVNNEAINTLHYIYQKIGKGIYVEIINNKLKFEPFYNLKIWNNWSNLVKVKENTLREYFDKKTEGLKYIYQKKHWRATNCLIQVVERNLNDNYIYEFKDMFEELLKSKKIKDTYFFINTKDFPILTKNRTEPYQHLYGENVPLTSYKYPSYSKIFSQSNRLDLSEDLLIPTSDCWDLITQKEFPPKFNNNYIFKNKSPNWEDKKPIAVFRGASTGCDTTLNDNPRLKLVKLSYKWKNDWLDVGITKEVKKSKKHISSEFLTHVNLKSLGIKLSEPISMEEQMKYKYIFDIEGNSAAYRLGALLQMKSVILKVESEYHIWIDKYLKPMKHYIPIKRDYSNLKEILEWCHTHDDACKQIADNAYDIYKKYYNKQSIFDYLENKI